MSYSDLYFTTHDIDLAMQAIPVLLQALGEKRVVNMLGPTEGRAAVLDDEGREIAPAAGEPGTWYAAVRTKRDPQQVLAAIELNVFGIAIAEPSEVQAVLGRWA